MQEADELEPEPDLELVPKPVAEPQQEVAQTIEAPEPWRAPVARMY